MRILIGLITICFISSGAEGAKKVLQKQNLILFVLKQNHNGPAERTEVYKDKHMFFCKTEVTPYHECSESPYTESTIKNIRLTDNTQIKKPLCREAISIFLYTNGKPKKYNGCSSDLPYSELIKELSKNCGRN